MAWFKVDDALAFNMKAVAAGNTALGLWVRAGSWSCQQLTDGFVPDAMVPALGGTQDDAQALADAGLWHPRRGGWVFHDWAEYQEPSEKVKERRAAARERMRAVRANKARTDTERARERADLFGGSSPNPDPTRPDPTLSTSNEVERPLSPFCPKHPNGTDKACRACGTARMAFEAARAAERNKPTPIPRRDPMCPHHPEWPLPCDKCAQIAAEAAIA